MRVYAFGADEAFVDIGNALFGNLCVCVFMWF